MAPTSSRIRALEAPVIPDRLYFKIGDVARLCSVEPYVLRFWETQFPQLKPNKSGTGQRLYRRREVELALEIKRLVHGEGYTISGARQALESAHRRSRPSAAPAPAQESKARDSGSRPAPSPRPSEAVSAAVGHIRAELREIIALLSAQQPRPPRPRGRVVSLSPESGNLFPL